MEENRYFQDVRLRGSLLYNGGMTIKEQHGICILSEAFCAVDATLNYGFRGHIHEREAHQRLTESITYHCFLR